MAHPDLDELMNALLPFAQEMLRKHGAFYPFAGSMSTAGEIAQVGGYTGDEQSPTKEVIDLLVGGLGEEARLGEIRAAAVCLDVRTIPPGKSEKTDAICVRLEHLNGESVDVFLPYRKGWLGKYTFGDLFATKGDRRIFGSGDGAT